jgi:hypothetical protein
MMGMLHANRTSYQISAFSFEGMPECSNYGDVPPETEITFRMTVREDNLSDLRSYLNDSQGFAGSVRWKDYEFDWQFGRLLEPLSDRDHSSNQRLDVVFSVKREYIRKVVRPIGQLPRDPTDDFLRSLHVLSQDLALNRRRRIELESAVEELDRHCLALDESDRALDSRKTALLATATPALLKMAAGRGIV